ncbi:MAG: hypothetical protein HY684_01470 [Chloroflexi bacterium]|nr:hypothetical protein [Chloroflexota bacterium]
MPQPTVVLLPEDEEMETPRQRTAARLGTLHGKVICVVNNGWNCMNLIQDEICRELTGVYGVRSVITRSKPATRPLSTSELDEISRSADAVINGIGN